MLLERQKDDNRITSVYDSSNILSSSYDRKNKSMTVVFRSGGGYRYGNVTESEYLMFERADSQGKVFSKMIRQKPTQKIDDLSDVDLLTMVAYVDTLKEEKKKKK